MVYLKVLHYKKRNEYFALFLEKMAFAILCKLHCTHARSYSVVHCTRFGSESEINASITAKRTVCTVQCISYPIDS